MFLPPKAFLGKYELFLFKNINFGLYRASIYKSFDLYD